MLCNHSILSTLSLRVTPQRTLYKPDHATALAKIREFYSEEDEKENGVVGIEVKIV